MKRGLQSFALTVFVMFSTSWSCGQNGPTPPPPTPDVVITFVPSATPGVTAYVFYKSSNGTYPGKGGTVAPLGTVVGTNAVCTATGCSFTDLAPITSATDTYWVSAQVVEGGVTYESQPSLPSNLVTVGAPVILTPPPGTPGAATGTQAKATLPGMVKGGATNVTAKLEWKARR